MKIRLTAAVLGASALALALWPRPATAWDSICYSYDDATKKLVDLQFTPGSRGCEGVEAARGRWRDPERQLDEHRAALEDAATNGGLPTSVLETVNLTVLTGPTSGVVLGGNGLTPSVDIRSPGAAKRAVMRSYSIDEMAQLPDFSFSLWDWGRGNEKCPLAPLPSPFDAPQTCHQFATHMGATNSNHFPPQSDTWFDHYHGLAMSRAAECKAQRKAIWSAEPVDRRKATDARFLHYFRACEVEALTYEAIGQHYLQDSWSAGHMWQRWGTTDLSDVTDVQAQGSGSAVTTWNGLNSRFRRLLISEIVAISAGSIHGSDPAVYESLPGQLTLHDQLCYPHEDVTAMDQGTALQVAGDLHLHDVLGIAPAHSSISITSLPYPASALSGQGDRLRGCTSGSIRAVYDTLKDAASYGSPTFGAASGQAPSFDPNNCRAPLVTNKGFYQGTDATDLQPVFGEIKAVLIDDIPDSVEAQARNDYGELRHAGEILAKIKPDGTEMATLFLDQTVSYQDEQCDADTMMCSQVPFTLEPRLFKMLQQEPNRCYDADPATDRTGCTVPAPQAAPLAPFVDPELPAQLGVLDVTKPETVQAYVFHASRAPALCDALGSFSVSALQNLVTNATTPEERGAACDTCAEYIAPFLRIGKDAQDYDTTAEPLCNFASADPANVPYVYVSGAGSADGISLARRYCNCGGLAAVTDAGLARFDAVPSGATVTFQQKGSTVPVGTLSKDLTAASGGRLLVGNGQGQVVGVREDVEVDMDDNDANGVTRLTFSGASDVQALAVANVADKELLLAGTVGTGELIAWDLSSNKLCERFSVAQVAGQGVYDIVLSGDAKSVWLSLRKGSPMSGALANVSLPDLAKCNGSGAGTLTWIAPPNITGFGPMALSPNGKKLAVGGRLSNTCSDQVKAADGIANAPIQVGCDRIQVYDFATSTWMTFDGLSGLPTRPGRFPYSVQWFKDSKRLSYATFQGVDNLGAGDSGWPKNFSASPRIPLGGTLRLADISAPSYSGGGGGPAMLRYWTYNLPMDSVIAGPTVVVDEGPNAGTGWVYVGTVAGTISGYSAAAHDATADPMWEASETDPETTLHITPNGSWYGGCSHSCSVGSGTCPQVCPGANNPGGFGTLSLGSPVRILVSY